MVRWMEALTEGVTCVGDFLPDDEVPLALDALFECVFNDQWSWIRTLCRSIQGYCEANSGGARVPRALGTAPFVVRGVQGERKLVTFVQWKAQRATSAYHPDTADPWIQRVLNLPDSTFGGEVIPEVRFPLELQGFKIVLRS